MGGGARSKFRDEVGEVSAGLVVWRVEMSPGATYAVLGLVRVGEAGVERGGLEDTGLLGEVSCQV